MTVSPVTPIVCPSCYRRRGSTAIIDPFPVAYLKPNGGDGSMWVYECTEDGCGYCVTEHELLFHEYRVKYHELLQVILSIRGWAKSQYNTLAGKLWVIERAVENYFEKGKDL